MDLQAHAADASVREPGRLAETMSQLCNDEGSSLGAGLPRPARDTSFSSNATTRTPASRVLTNPWQSLSAGGSSGWRLVWSFSSKALSRRRWVYATRSPAMSVGDGLLRAGDRSSSKMEIASVTRGSFNWWSISQLAAERRTAVWSVRLAAGTSGGYISTWRAARRPVVALCDPLRRRALALDRANAYWKKTPLRSCPTPGEPTLV